MSYKQYLGDAVYAGLDDGMIKLTTSDGIKDTNTIYLAPEVFAALIIYHDQLINAKEIEEA